MVKNQSFALYIHIPFCHKHCHYCAFVKTTWSPELELNMVAAMIQEIKSVSQFLTTKRVSTIFIGGGTPSSLSPKAMSQLLEAVYTYFSVDNTSEKTSEMNPESTSKSKLSVLKEYGFNRLSFGVQSFIPSELKFLGRSHDAERVKRAVELSHQAGFTNINLDLIFGLPNSTVDDVHFNVEQALSLSPTHISTYSLTIEPKTVFKKQRVRPVTSDIELKQYLFIQTHLKKQGFKHYEVSAFAKPGLECKHNLAYWHLTPFIGIGPNASSFFDGRHATNIANLDQYLACPDPVLFTKKIKPLPQSEIIRDYMVANLRRLDGINLAHAQKRLGVHLSELFQDSISKLVQDGFLKQTKQRLRVTKKGLSVLDSVLLHFI